MLLTGIAQATPRSCSEFLLPMHDGVRLYGWVNREDPAVPRPVLLTISSYQNNSCPGASSYYVSPQVANQFTMVFINMRGSGASEGTFDLFGPDTQSDIHTIVQWTASQPWSNGTIIATGASGNGIFIIDALREPQVTAAAPITACPDLYRCFHHGGANGQQISGVYFANMASGYEAGAQAREKYGTYSNPDPAQQLAAFPEVEATALQNPLYDDYWSQRSLLSQSAALQKPIMWTTSDFDLLEPLDALPLAANAYLNMGMSHSVWCDFALSQCPAAYRQTILNQLNQFVSYYGLGQGQPPPRVALMTSDGGFPAWEKQDAFMRTEDAWPLPETNWTDLYLSGEHTGSATSLNDGSLTTDRPHQRTTSAAETVPLESSPGSGQDLRTEMLAPVLARADGGQETVDASTPLWDLRREEVGGLTYTTPAFTQNLEATGPILLDLWARTVASDFTWSIRLTDVAPDGSSEWITDGYLRASLRQYDARRSQRISGRIVRVWQPFDAAEPIPLERPAEYLIQIADASNIFRAGHRLRLDILPVAGAGFDTGNPPGAGTVTILHDHRHPSRLQLPIIPARCQSDIATSPAQGTLSACAQSYTSAISSRG